MSESRPAAPDAPPSPEGAAARVSPFGATTERRIQTICLLILTAIAVGATLQALRGVMIPFALAAFIAIAMAPIVDGLADRTRLSRPVAVALTMVLGVLLIAILGAVVASSLNEFDEVAAAFRSDDPDGVVPRFLARFGIEGGDTLQRAGEAVAGILPMVAATLGSLLAQGANVVIFLMFLLVEQGRPRPADRGTMKETVRGSVKHYIAVKFVTSLVTGIGSWLLLMIIGVPAAAFFGLLAFLLNFVPAVGSAIAVLLPIPILVVGGSPLVTVILALALPGALQFVVGQVWENKILGEKTDLRASVVLLGLMFWGHIWGVIGMVLATPITAVGKTLLEAWDVTRPLARLMGRAGTGAAADAAEAGGSAT
ncbi:MAG: AI-2E family transporter [Planctomycetota bacterium]